MATVKGVNQTLIDNMGESMIVGGQIKIKTKCIKDSYALTTGNTSGDIIKLFGALPAGANISEIHLSVTAAQTSLTFNLGDSASATRYASANTGLQSAAPVETIIAGSQYVIGTNSGDNQILLTTGGATATAGTLHVEIYYTDAVD